MDVLQAGCSLMQPNFGQTVMEIGNENLCRKTKPTR